MSDDSLTQAELRTKTLHGLRWAVIARPFGEVVLIGSMVLLAHLISPAEFGRYAVAAIAGSVAVIPLAGVGAALVQRPELSREHLQAGFALALLIGVGLVALVLAAAGAIVAPIYGARTAEFVRLAAPLCFIIAAGAVPAALLQRRLAIRRFSVIELASTLTRVGATIGMALAGLNGFALVLGWLAGELLEMILVWASVPPPLPRWRREPIRDLLSFGGPASLAAASWFGFRNCDYAIIGARLGAVPTGLYFRAYTLGVEYQKKVSNVMNSVGFPALSRTQNAEEQEALRERMVRMLTIVLFPLLVLLAIEAPVLVPWLFGHRWAPAVVPTQVLAVGGASTLVIDTAGATLMATGRTRAVMGFGWGHFCVYALTVFFVAPLGITAVAIAASAVHTAFLLVAYALMLRGSGENMLRRLWHDIQPASVSCLAPAAAALPASIALRSAHVSPVAYLPAVSVLGVAVYLLALRVCFPASLQSLSRFVAHLLPGNPLQRLRRRIAPGWHGLGLRLSSRILTTLLVLVAGVAGGAFVATAEAPVARVASARACTTTLTPGAGASAIASAIVSAHDGSTVCLASGSYPFVRVVGATHKRYVTVRPAVGATATVAGMEVRESSYLRFQGLHMTEGFNMRDGVDYRGSHNYQFIGDTFEEPLYGIVLDGGAGPIKHVLIERNYMHRVHLEQPEVEGRCHAGYAQGQDVTIFYAEGVRIARNTFDEAAWHYLQGGGAGPEGVDVEHNLFEGHVLLACSHLNLWQIWNGGTDDTFKHNVAIGEGTAEHDGRSEEAATDGLIFENGPGSAQCGTTMRNTTVEDNLFVDAAASYAIQIYTTAGATIKNNTVVRSQYGSGLLVDNCAPSTDAVMTHNIDVENTSSAAAFSFQCARRCLFDANVSDDASARRFGARHFKTDWTPRWVTTRWDRASERTPPAGYYVARGLRFPAGYRGGGGP